MIVGYLQHGIVLGAVIAAVAAMIVRWARELGAREAGCAGCASGCAGSRAPTGTAGASPSIEGAGGGRPASRLLAASALVRRSEVRSGSGARRA